MQRPPHGEPLLLAPREFGNQLVQESYAVVVTFAPPPDVVENLRVLYAQVSTVIVVDNGSKSENLSILRAASLEGLFELVEMGSNRGLGAALNAGIEVAINRGAASVLLFDQDGRPEPLFVAAMQSCLQASSPSVGILVPRYIDRNTGESIPPLGMDENSIEAAMTSGSLIRLSAYQQAGGFREDLIVDVTDFEYSVRLRSLGYTIAQCKNAVLQHSPGARKAIKAFGRTLCTVSHASPKRRYYVARNNYILIGQLGAFPTLRRLMFRYYVVELMKILLFENHKFMNLRMVLKGLVDGHRKKMGLVVPLG